MTLSTKSAERITLLYRAAKRNGSLVSVQELSRLLPESTSVSEVEEAISSIPWLNSTFELRSGYLTERSECREDDQIRLEAESRRTARENLSHASRFISLLHTSGFVVVAVSGSTSYGSSSVSKDTDLFCVAPAGRMWLSLSRGLVMARVYALLSRGTPALCLSCVMDEDSARSAFESHRHPLFARDAIEAKVLLGRKRYASLMRGASWISDYYPVAYGEAVSRCTQVQMGAQPSAFATILNRVLYTIVGGYIRARSSLLNRRFRAQRKSGDVFGVRSGEDHLIYESRRYKDLRKEYEMTESATRQVTS